MSTRYNTGNPIESTDVRDMSDNAKNFDEFSNSGADTFTDRFGAQRKTIDGVIRSVGIPIVGNFTAGCTVTDSNQGVQEVGGSVYRWKGALPKIVPPSSTPIGTGGISPSGDWVDVGDASAYSRIIGDLVQPNGVSLVGGAASTADIEYLSSNASTFKFESTIESVFAQKVRLGQSDCYVLVQGDSTGDADNEWFRLTANNIAAMYPTHSVKYLVWVHGSTSWSSPVVISVGSGTRTIWFYNGSRPGAVAGYWAGNRAPYAFNNLSLDVIFTNFGLNVPTSIYAQQEQHAEHLATLKTRQPYAEIISCIQPVDYSLLDRNPLRSNGQKLVNKLYGVREVDVMRKFLDLVESTGGDYTPWYVDSLHPSPAGSAEWAKLTTSALLTSKGDQPSSAGLKFKNSDMPNGLFKSFLSGASSPPDLWVCPGTTALKDQVYYETFGQSCRVSGVGSSTGVFRLENANELMQRFYESPQIVIAARLRSSGGTSGKCGKIFFAHSVSTAYTERQSTQAPTDSVNDGFRWVFLLVDRSFWIGKSDFSIGIFSGETGEFVSVDRVMVMPSLLLADCSDQKYDLSVEKSDSSHTVPAKGSTSRTFTASTPVSVKQGMLINTSIYPSVAGVKVSAFCNTTGLIEVFYTNITGSPISFPASNVIFKISL